MDLENAPDARRVAQELVALIDSITTLEGLPDPVVKLCLEDCLAKASGLGDFFVNDDFVAIIGGPEGTLNREFGLLDEEAEIAVDLVLNVEADLERALEHLNGEEARGRTRAGVLQKAINSLGHLASFLRSVLSR
jgi:hypothetical protein